MHLLRLLAAVAVIVTTPAALLGQARPVPLGTYQDQVTRATAGPALGTGRVAAANTLLDGVVPILRRNAAAMTAPPDMCMRITSHASEQDGRVRVTAGVSFLIVIDGQCFGLTTTAVEIIVNDVRPLLGPTASLPGPFQRYTFVDPGPCPKLAAVLRRNVAPGPEVARSRTHAAGRYERSARSAPAAPAGPVTGSVNPDDVLISTRAAGSVSYFSDLPAVEVITVARGAAS